LEGFIFPCKRITILITLVFESKKTGISNARIYGKASHFLEHGEGKVLVLLELGSNVYAQ